MWILRYFLPIIIAVALGIFAAQNLNQRITIQFLFWRFHDVSLVLIMAVSLVVGFFVRYYAAFVKWMDKKWLERATKKMVESRKGDVELRIEKDTSEEMEAAAEEGLQRSLEDEKTGENEKEWNV
jgi:uncharacterized integral membrane protein